MDPDDLAYTVYLCSAESETTKGMFFGPVSGPDKGPEKGPEKALIPAKHIIYTDDTVHKIKRKILHTMHKTGWASVVYDEMYLFAYVEDTVINAEKIFDAADSDTVSREFIAPLFSANPGALERLPETVGYDDLRRALADANLELLAKLPIGASIETAAPVESNPFFAAISVSDRGRDPFLHNESRLLLNYGRIAKQTLYLCLARDVLERIAGNADLSEYVCRNYYPRLYDKGVRDNESFKQKRVALLRETRTATDITDSDKAVDLFRAIHATATPHVEFSGKGVEELSLRIRGGHKRTIQLDQLFKRMHASRAIPFIKFNPGNRRENLFRIYYEQISSNGKKIPFLAKTAIMKLSREIGRAQQISLALDVPHMFQSAPNALAKQVKLAYLHFEHTGDVVVQLSLRRPFIPAEIHAVLQLILGPAFSILNRDLKSTGFGKLEYTNWMDSHMQAVHMDYVLRLPAVKPVDVQSIPGIYAICTINKERRGQDTTVRIKRVENFREMDAAQILITELYAQVHMGEIELRDIVSALDHQLGINADDASVMISDYLSRSGQTADGEILDKPGFPLDIRIVAEDVSSVKMLELRASGIASPFYLSNIHAYLDALVKITQFPKTVEPFIRQLKRLADSVKRPEEEDADTYVNVQPLQHRVVGNVRDMLKNIGIFDDDEDEDAHEKEVVIPFSADDDDADDEPEDVQKWIKALDKNAKLSPTVPNPVPKQVPLPALTKHTEPASPVPNPAPLPALTTRAEPETQVPKQVPTQVPTQVPQQVPQPGSLLSSIIENISNAVSGTFEPGSSKESNESKGPILYDSEESAKPDKSADKSADKSVESPIEATDKPVDKPVESQENPSDNSNNNSNNNSIDTSSDNSNDTSNGPILYESEPEAEPEPDSESGSKSKSGSKSISGGTKNAKDASNEDDDAKLVPDGMLLSNPNPFLRRMRKRDPDLFLSNDVGKFASYSTSCQPISRHPVILNQSEFDKTDPKSYSHSVKYGSDPQTQHHFICPRFWCFLTNSAISEEDVRTGTCGKIIPKGAKKIPTGAYVYQLSEKNQVPGYRDDAHPEGHCLPCCTQKTWESKGQETVRAKCSAKLVPSSAADAATAKQPAKKKSVLHKTANYIISLDTFPLDAGRWGYLPVPVQLFLGVDYLPAVDKNNPALVVPDKSVLLRHGVEQVTNQSFMGVFAHMYAVAKNLPKPPTVAAFREVLIAAIDLDVFARAQNAALLSSFMSKTRKGGVSDDALDAYKSTNFYKSLDMGSQTQRAYLEDSIRAHQRFQAFLRDPKVRIDHTYLWDFMGMAIDAILPKGLNIVMMETKRNDMVERIELICPKSMYSVSVFDPKKESVLILKHGEFYEPVFMYEQPTGSAATNATYAFSGKTLHRNIKYILANVEFLMKKHCAPMPSLPRIYQVRPPTSLAALVERSTGLATADKRVLNYQGKTIGLILSSVVSGGVPVFVPCDPTADAPELPAIYMDDESIPQEYEPTKRQLAAFASKLGCRPIYKVLEDGLIVGILTETNQFVPTHPNEDLAADELRTYRGVSHFAVDKLLSATVPPDAVDEARHIMLDTQFYHAFRSQARNLLAQFGNSARKRRILELVNDPAQIYANKVVRVERELKLLVGARAVFVDMDAAVLAEIGEINECQDADDAADPYCLVKENGEAQLVIPKRHLISGHDNEVIYFGRLADELVRNERVKRYMFNSKKFLNASNPDYAIGKREFILAQSALTAEYFADLDADEVAESTNYDTAKPSVRALYSTEPVPLADQLQVQSASAADIVRDTDPSAAEHMECVARIVDLIGNPSTSQWRRYLPKDGPKEMVFRDTPECTLELVARLMRAHVSPTITRGTVKGYLREAYAALIAREPSVIKKIAEIMRKQGKSKMFEALAKHAGPGIDALESIVMADAYPVSDLDIWILASHFRLPVIVFNPNGLKGFGPKELQWVRMGGEPDSAFHFIRSNIASISNKIYEYNLIFPALKLDQMRDGFAAVVQTAVDQSLPNIESVDTRLRKIAFVPRVAVRGVE